MPANHVLLETIELTQSGISSVVLDNIPQIGYTDLKVVVSPRTTRTGTDLSDEIRLTFNSITSGYTTLMIEGNGSTTRTVADASGSYFGRGSSPADNATASTYGITTYYIPNYVGSANKTITIDTVSEHNGTEGIHLLVSGLVTSTAAITSMTFTAVGTYDAGSTFSIYGIAQEGTTPTKAPLATGGNKVENDGTYWIHTFTSSGFFTPTKELACDYLVVAGGGGGEADAGGGGGAGGYRTSIGGSALSVIAQTYSIQVGAGGAGGLVNTLAAVKGSASVFSTITSNGGGFGGRGSGQLGGAGGSGGGGSGRGQASGTFAGGTATPSGQGNNGGSGVGNGSGQQAGGGGGGAGAAGTNASAGAGGAGGNGLANSISGTSVTYAGGGGGGILNINSNTAGAGGTGGGGAGNASGGAGTAGTANLGGGGGASTYNPTGSNGGAGGSGVVIIRYAMV